MVMLDPLESLANEGEFPDVGERLVVASGWGRLRSGFLDDGRSLVDEGAVIATLEHGGSADPVVVPSGGVFLSWLVDEGEWVAPGRPLARIRRD